MIVHLARDILAFVMFCINGESRSSLLIESTDSMILYIHMHVHVYMLMPDCKLLARLLAGQAVFYG